MSRTLEDSDDLTILDREDGRQGHPVTVWNGRLAMLAAAVLIVALAEFAASATWEMLGYGGVPAPTVAPAAALSGEAPGRIDVRRIIDAHLFGVHTAAVEQPQALPPETDLALSLKGIVFSDVAEDARAIIASAEGPHGAYAVGAYLPGDARLIEIRRNLVVLDRGDRLETLRLESSAQKRGDSPGPPHRLYDERGDFELAKMLGGFQTRLQTDPSTAMSLVRITPERDGGNRLKGVRVYPGPERGFMERIKLEPGDIITHINGVKLDSTARGLEALRTLAAAREINLKVRRGDRRLDFTYAVSR